MTHPHHQPEWVAPQRPLTQPVGYAAAPDAELASLRGQIKQLRAVAFVGAALGLLGTALGAFALARPLPAAAPAVATPAAVAAPSTAAAAPAASTPWPKPDAVAAAPAGTIVLGTPGKGLPVVDVYEDFQCPACASIEPYVAQDLTTMASSGKYEVRYHMMSFLDQMLKNDSSVRAAAGGFCAHEQGKFDAWHSTLFSEKYHPKNEGDGWTDAQLKQMAGVAGVDQAKWASCVASKKYATQVTQANDTSLQSGVNSTPTFMLNGQRIDLRTALSSGGLKAFVDAQA